MTANPSVKERLESSDMILYIGPLPSDSATGGFSYGLPTNAKVTMHSEFISIGDEKWEGLHFVPIIKKLVAKLRSNASSLAQPNPNAAVNALLLWFHAPFGEANVCTGYNKRQFGPKINEVSQGSSAAAPFLEVFRTVLSGRRLHNC